MLATAILKNKESAAVPGGSEAPPSRRKHGPRGTRAATAGDASPAAFRKSSSYVVLGGLDMFVAKEFHTPHLVKLLQRLDELLAART